MMSPHLHSAMINSRVDELAREASRRHEPAPRQRSMSLRETGRLRRSLGRLVARPV
jgi:hypothetical protein